jgi:hypothetical protein
MRLKGEVILYVMLQSRRFVSFWTIKTTISPNAKDAIRKRIVVKQYDGHATHYLQIP